MLNSTCTAQILLEMSENSGQIGLLSQNLPTNALRYHPTLGKIQI